MAIGERLYEEWSHGWNAGRQDGYKAGRRSMRDDIRRWLEGKSAGVTPGRLLEDLDEEVPVYEDEAFMDALEMGLRDEDLPLGRSSETSEQEHAHECGRCGDTWIHADDDCQAIYGRAPYATCPICQEG